MSNSLSISGSGLALETLSRTGTVSYTPTASGSLSTTRSLTVTASTSGSHSATHTGTEVPVTATASRTATASTAPSLSLSTTLSFSGTPSLSTSDFPAATATATTSLSPTGSLSPSLTLTCSSATLSLSPTASMSPTLTLSPDSVPILAFSATPRANQTFTVSFSLLDLGLTLPSGVLTPDTQYSVRGVKLTEEEPQRTTTPTPVAPGGRRLLDVQTGATLPNIDYVGLMHSCNATTPPETQVLGKAADPNGKAVHNLPLRLDVGVYVICLNVSDAFVAVPQPVIVGGPLAVRVDAAEGQPRYRVPFQVVVLGYELSRADQYSATQISAARRIDPCSGTPQPVQVVQTTRPIPRVTETYATLNLSLVAGDYHVCYGHNGVWTPLTVVIVLPTPADSPLPSPSPQVDISPRPSSASSSSTPVAVIVAPVVAVSVLLLLALLVLWLLSRRRLRQQQAAVSPVAPSAPASSSSSSVHQAPTVPSVMTGRRVSTTEIVMGTPGIPLALQTPRIGSADSVQKAKLEAHRRMAWDKCYEGRALGPVKMVLDGPWDSGSDPLSCLSLPDDPPTTLSFVEYPGMLSHRPVDTMQFRAGLASVSDYHNVTLPGVPDERPIVEEVEEDPPWDGTIALSDTDAASDGEAPVSPAPEVRDATPPPPCEVAAVSGPELDPRRPEALALVEPPPLPDEVAVGSPPAAAADGWERLSALSDVADPEPLPDDPVAGRPAGLADGLRCAFATPLLPTRGRPAFRAQPVRITSYQVPPSPLSPSGIRTPSSLDSPSRGTTARPAPLQPLSLGLDGDGGPDHPPHGPLQHPFSPQYTGFPEALLPDLVHSPPTVRADSIVLSLAPPACPVPLAEPVAPLPVAVPP
eukprot:EG_transcript_1855